MMKPLIKELKENIDLAKLEAERQTLSGEGYVIACITYNDPIRRDIDLNGDYYAYMAFDPSDSSAKTKEFYTLGLFEKAAIEKAKKLADAYYGWSIFEEQYATVTLSVKDEWTAIPNLDAGRLVMRLTLSSHCP